MLVILSDFNIFYFTIPVLSTLNNILGEVYEIPFLICKKDVCVSCHLNNSC